MSHTGAKRPFQHLPENEQKTNTEKEAPKHEKMNLSQQGNGKRAQQESTVEQRVHICSMHPRPQSKDEKLKNISKIINEYLQSLLKKYDLNPLQP